MPGPFGVRSAIEQKNAALEGLLANQKAEAELPHAERGLLSEIGYRESAARHNNMQAELGERTMDANVVLKEQEVIEKEETIAQLIANKPLMEKIRSVEIYKQDYLIGLAASKDPKNQRELTNILFSEERWKNAQAAEKEDLAIQDKEFKAIYHMDQYIDQNNPSGFDVQSYFNRQGIDVPMEFQDGLTNNWRVSRGQAMERVAVTKGYFEDKLKKQTSADIDRRLYEDKKRIDQKYGSEVLSHEIVQQMGLPEGAVVTRSKKDNSYTILYDPSKDDQNTRGRKIKALTDRGVPLAGAQDIVDGNIKIEVVPQTGEVRHIDMINQTVTSLPIGQSGEKVIPEPPEGHTLWDKADKATGFVSGALAVPYAEYLGQIPGAPIPEETIQARSDMKIATNGLIRSLSINPKFPVGEINRIKDEVELEPAWNKSAPALRQKMISLDRSLKTQLAQMERDAADMSLPQDVRSSQASNASAIRNFLPILGVREEATTVDKITSAEDVRNTSQEALREYINNATDEELNALPPEVTNEIKRKLK